MNNRQKKAQRIKSSNEIASLLKSGKKWRCQSYIIIYRKNCLSFDRFGVIVSRRVGNAVTRNKIKRNIRELFRCNQRKSPPFFDILFKPIEQFSFKQEKNVGNNYLTWIEQLNK